jgi:predicted alpha/beta-fold hydrolase
LFAADDPVVDATALDRHPRPRHVRVLKTAHGGHLGFLGAPCYDGGFRWMDALLLEWTGAPAKP